MQRNFTDLATTDQNRRAIIVTTLTFHDMGRACDRVVDVAVVANPGLRYCRRSLASGVRIALVTGKYPNLG